MEVEDGVTDAVKSGDIQKLREISLRPGGFRGARRIAWPYLLQVDPSTLTPTSTTKPTEPTEPIASTSTSPPPQSPSWDDEPHKDESQIKLDTDRSFVLYPQLPDIRKEPLKSRLNTLITRILRKRRKLAYVQGYHDVLAVLLLTLCPGSVIGEEAGEDEERTLERCAERISLYRLRDAMGPGLEPLLGLLRILRRLIRLADPDYAALIEQTTPLPYYALSNLLTLFAHDIPTLPLIQHIWDYLLSREPIAVLYLAAALILERKDELLQRIKEDGDEGALYVLLSGLPPLVDAPNLPTSSSFSQGDDSPPPTPSSTSSSAANSLPPYTPASTSSLSSTPSPPMLLPALLARADQLYTSHPPSTPQLRLAETLGPGSVHRAVWPPDLTEDDAERLVLRPETLCLSLSLSDDEDAETADELKGPSGPLGRGRRSREQEMRTLMAVLVVGAGVMIAIYGAEGGLRGLGDVDWQGLGRVVLGVVKEGAGRLARGG